MVFIIIAHLLFAGIASFELLNFAGILNYPLHFSWLALVVVTAIAWLAWTLIYRPLKKQGQNFLAAQVGFCALGSVLLDFFGNIYQLYTSPATPWFDQFAHFVGGISLGTIAFAILWYFNNKQKLKLPLAWLGLFAICLALTVGVFYEFEEYLEDYFTGTKKLGNSFDTADDLAWDFLGALTIIIPLAIFVKEKRK